MEEMKRREELGAEFKWRLEDIYADDQKWEEDFRAVKALMGGLAQYEGRIQEGAEVIAAVLQQSEKLDRGVERLYVYARMRRDEDNSNAVYQALFERIQALATEAGSRAAYIVPELMALDGDTLLALAAAEPALQLYDYFFRKLLRTKEHILSPAEEKILALSADVAGAPQQIFTMLNNADITFPTVKNAEGEEVEITKGRYGSLMESQDRQVRLHTFQSFYTAYGKLLHTIGASLNASVKNDVFYAQVRKYPSSLEAALDGDHVPPAVYDSLIASVHGRLDLMYRYMKLRKKLLGVDQLHMYDIYVPLVAEYEGKFSYAQAQELVLKAMAPLGEDYGVMLRQAYQSGWIDVYENRGKTSGAYSWGSYDTNPYVLLNFDQKLDDVFTLAHELGHSLHSYYSDQSQPYVYSQYPIFLAEVASTVNESLLIDYLLQNSRSREEKMYLLNHYLEQFRGTVFRQTMFAEFEKLVHEKLEAGEGLVAESFNALYLQLNRLYYGPEVVMDDEIQWEWCRIPHFYSAFYVYKYATGFSAATAIKGKILAEGEPAVKRYREFLAAGGSDDPIHILQRVGVDLTTPAPVNQALDYFAYLLEEMEKLVG
jgi:oligoendopeptidase F